MTNQISSTTKCCATCSKWLGAREPHHQLHIVYVEDSHTTYGKCGYQMNSSQEQQACRSGCSKYEKWSVLK